MHCRGYCEYTRTMKYARTSAICAPCRSFHVHCLKKIFTDGPTSGSWSKLLSVGAAGVLSTGSISGLYAASIARSSSRFCTADTALLQVLRGSILLVLPLVGVLYCSYSQYSQYLDLMYRSCSQYSQCSISATSIPILSVFGVRNVLDTSVHTRSMKYTGSIYLVYNFNTAVRT